MAVNKSPATWPFKEFIMYNTAKFFDFKMFSVNFFYFKVSLIKYAYEFEWTFLSDHTQIVTSLKIYVT